MKRVTMYEPMHVMDKFSKMIYVINRFEVLGSDTLCLNFSLDLVAGIDYISPDYSDAQGYVSKEAFVEDVHYDSLTVYLMHESLKDRLDEEGYEVVDINKYKIHEYQMEV